MSNGAIHEALTAGKTKALESTALYRRIFELAERRAGHPLPRAMVPRIKIVGPKIKRNLTTDWYAHRVEDRFKLCLGNP
jgi:hypothetical protein